MPIAKSPAFQFYAADYLADENVVLMTLEEEGAYIRAMSYCWREGSIPSDPEMLSRLLKGASMSAVEVVSACFKVSPKDSSRLVHSRLDAERKKQAIWKQKSADAGKKSGKVRREKKLHTEPTLNQPLNLVEPNMNSSSSSSSSSSTTTKAKSNTLAQSVPPEELAGTLPLIDGTDYEVSKKQLADWSEAYPAVNVKQQLLEFKEWCKANPAKRKTRRGVCPAIVRWLGKEQDKGGILPAVSRFAPPPQPKLQILARPGGAA